MTTLRIEVLSHWRVGTGRDRPGALDATCLRDVDGLPIIPGKHLKGLLRDAMIRAQSFGWISLAPAALFGGEISPQTAPRPGMIRIETARLCNADRAALGGNPELISMLFETRRATAMGPEGIAKPGSLRFEEVAVPMVLEANLHPLEAAPEGWKNALNASLPLLRGIGAQRTRGLGRCSVTIRAEDGS